MKQQLFVDHYLVSGSSADAALKAGYAPKTCAVTGSKLLSVTKVAVEIRKRREKFMEKIDITAERVLQEYAAIALANMSDYMRPGVDGEPRLDFSNLTRVQSAALQEVTVEEFVDGRSDKRQVRRIKFKLADKVRALEGLGRHLGLFEDKDKTPGKHTLMGMLLDEIETERDAKAAGREVVTIEHDPGEARVP